jgi:hypothetical protein
MKTETKEKTTSPSPKPLLLKHQSINPLIEAVEELVTRADSENKFTLAGNWGEELQKLKNILEKKPDITIKGLVEGFQTSFGDDKNPEFNAIRNITRDLVLKDTIKLEAPLADLLTQERENPREAHEVNSQKLILTTKLGIEDKMPHDPTALKAALQEYEKLFLARNIKILSGLDSTQEAKNIADKLNFIKDQFEENIQGLKSKAVAIGRENGNIGIIDNLDSIKLTDHENPKSLAQNIGLYSTAWETTKDKLYGPSATQSPQLAQVSPEENLIINAEKFIANAANLKPLPEVKAPTWYQKLFQAIVPSWKQAVKDYKDHESATEKGKNILTSLNIAPTEEKTYTAQQGAEEKSRYSAVYNFLVEVAGGLREEDGINMKTIERSSVKAPAPEQETRLPEWQKILQQHEGHGEESFASRAPHHSSQNHVQQALAEHGSNNDHGLS